jgi:hypothetical protein
VGQGYWERAKDEFKEEFQAWNYAIRGCTIDGRELRIAIALDHQVGAIIVTAIQLRS